MAGKKGRSGRKPLLEEETVEELLDLSATILRRWLENDKVREDRKIPIVTQLIVKRIKQKVDFDGKLAIGKIKVEFVDGNS